MQKVRLNISGMSCVNCSNAVERVANKIEGVSFAKVSFANGIGEFDIDSENTLEILKEKIKKLGYEIAFNADEFEKKQNAYIRNLRDHFIMAVIISSAVMALEMLIKPSYFINSVVILLSSFVLFYNGKMFFSHAISSLKSRNYDMSVLVALGAGSAFLHSVFVFLFSEFIPSDLNYLYVSGSAMIITFVLLGKFLEARSKSNAMSHLKTLMDMSPKVALLIKPDGQIVEVAVNDLKIGDVVVVKNGYAIPSDGVIIQGGAEIDMSALTGESLPMYKKVGDDVFSGTINTNGYISVRITKLSNQTLLSQILALLSDASTKKMPISRLADRVANVFVPSVIAISLVTFIAWVAITSNFTYAIISAVCVLIISCPCALGLATPIAVISALSRGAKGGVLIKNPEIIENIKDIKFAVFDKTGTLSRGEISVVDSNLNDKELSLIAGVENLSEHPISKSIVRFAKQKNVKIAKLSGEFKNIVGFGITYKDDSYEIIIGNKRLLESFDINLDKDDESKISEKRGVVYCVINGNFVGYITIADEIRDEANDVISNLKELGITPVILSGDDVSVVSEVADKLGVDKFYSNTLPDEKFNILKDMQKDAKVMFVGDGINDSLCLKQADVGIAMSSGSDIAKSAGDVVLIKNNLRDVIFMLSLGKKSIMIIKQNLFWAFIYNLVCIPVAAGVLYPAFGILLNPMFGALAMCFSSVNVVLNSIRLRFLKI